ncbi:MAG: hypothetical protein KJZ58_12045 [Flavobacteriales bacterium]|nr:hypothetical protein [Flavobacteriales bacterium]
MAPAGRPKSLTWLCAASFTNQAVVFPLYVLGIFMAYAMRGVPAAELRELVINTYGAFIQPAQQDQLEAYIALLQRHGVALMAILALRTLARFIGTLRIWQGWRDGFHIYTTAQLLGVLLPILVVGPETFNILGFILVLNWCYLYYIHRKALRGSGEAPLVG